MDDAICLGDVSSIDFLIPYGAALLALATLPVVVDDFVQNLSLLVAGVTVLVVPLMALALTSATALQKLNAPRMSTMKGDRLSDPSRSTHGMASDGKANSHPCYRRMK